ncbi:hypothetical protein HK097_003667, partial [Rhizophlyctis rosea]
MTSLLSEKFDVEETGRMLKQLEALMKRYEGQEEVEEVVALLGKCVRRCRGMVSQSSGISGVLAILKDFLEGEGVDFDSDRGGGGEVDLGTIKEGLKKVKERRGEEGLKGEAKVQRAERLLKEGMKKVKEMEEEVARASRESAERCRKLEAAVRERDAQIERMGRERDGEIWKALQEREEVHMKALREKEVEIQTLQERLKSRAVESDTTSIRTKMQIQMIQTRIPALESTISHLRTDLQTATNHSETLQKDLANQKHQTTDLTHRLQQSETKLAQTQSKQLEKISALEQQIRETEQHLHKEIELRTALRIERDEVRSQNEELDDEVHDLENRLKAEKESNVRFEEIISTLKMEMEQVKGQVVHAEGGLKKVKEALREKEKELLRESEEREKAESDRAKMAGMMELLKDQVKVDQQSLESKTAQVESLRAQLRDQALSKSVSSEEGGGEKPLVEKEVITYYENEIRMLTQEIQEEKAARLAREAGLEKLVDSLSELEHNLTEVKRAYELEVASAKTHVEKEEKLVAELEASRSALATVQRKAHEIELNGVRSKRALEETQKQVGELEDAFEKVRGESRTLGADKESLKAEVTRLRNHVADLEGRVAVLTRQKDVQTDLVESLNVELEQLRKEGIDFAEKLNSKTKELAEAQKSVRRCGDLEEQVVALKKDNEQFEAELEDARNEYGILSEKLEMAQGSAEREGKTARLEVERLKADVGRLEKALNAKASQKSRDANIESSEADKKVSSLQATVTNLQQALEKEKAKTQKYQKSAGNLVNKLTTSFADLASNTSKGSLADLRDHPRRNRSSSTTNLVRPPNTSLTSLIANLRESLPQDLTDLETHLSALELNVATEMRAVLTLQTSIENDPEADDEIKHLLSKFVDLQQTRLTDAHMVVGSAKEILGDFRTRTELELRVVGEDVLGVVRRCEEVERRSIKLVGERDRLKEEVKTLEKRVEEGARAAGERDGLVLERDRVVGERDKLKEEVGRLEKKVAEVERSREQVQGALVKLENDFMARSQEMNRHVEAAAENEKTLKRRVKELEKGLTESKERTRRAESKSREVSPFRNPHEDGCVPVQQFANLQAAKEALLTRSLQLEEELRQSQSRLQSGEKQVANLQGAKEALLTRSLELEEQLRQSQSRLQSAENHVREIHQAESLAQKRCMELETGIKTKEMEILRATTELDLTRRDKRSEIDTLRDECDRLKRMATAAQSHQSEAQESLKQTIAQMAEAQLVFKRQKAELEQTVLSLKASRSTGEIELSLAQEHLKKTQTSLEKSQKAVEDLEKSKIQLEVERTVLEESIIRKDTTIRKLSMEIESLSDTKGLADSKRQGAELEVSVLQAAVRKAMYDAEIATGEKMRLDGEKKQLEAELERRTTALVGRKREVDVLRGELDSLNGWAAALEGMQEGEGLIRGDGGAREGGDRMAPNPGRSISKLQKEHRMAQERVASLELQIKLERAERGDLERRWGQVKKGLEEDVSSLTKRRDQLEERVSFLENQRRVMEIRISDLMDAVATGNQAKANLRTTTEKLQNTSELLFQSRAEIQSLTTKLTETTAKFNVSSQTAASYLTRLQTLETQNTSLSTSLQTLQKDLSQKTLANKTTHETQLRQISARLDAQSRERERVEKNWMKNTGEMVRGYEDEIKRLMEEVKKLRNESSVMKKERLRERREASR